MDSSKDHFTNGQGLGQSPYGDQWDAFLALPVGPQAESEHRTRCEEPWNIPAHSFEERWAFDSVVNLRQWHRTLIEVGVLGDAPDGAG